MESNSTSAQGESSRKESDLVQAIYTSRSLVGEDQQKAILAECQQKNPRHNVTGVLVSHEKRFLQVLEGPSSYISTLIGKIEKDPRHTDFHLMSISSLSERNFSDWSMAAVSLDPLRFTQLVKDCMAGGNEALGEIRDFLCFGVWRK